MNSSDADANIERDRVSQIELEAGKRIQFRIRRVFMLLLLFLLAPFSCVLAAL